MVAAASRPIEAVPAALVMLMAAAGKLPVLARPPKQFGFREPGLEETAALVWVFQWQGCRVDATGIRRPIGLCAYWDRYDFGSASDVREIVYLDGSKRSVFDIIRYLRVKTHDDGRRLVGGVVASNEKQLKTLLKLGVVVTRHVVEDA